MRTIAGALVGLVALAGAVWALREATQSTHYTTGPDTALRVVVEARSNESEPTQTLTELTEARVHVCRLEVTADVVGDLEVLSQQPHRYATHLQPALDSSDRKQLQGCLEDWNLDHHLMNVLSMTDIGADEVPDDGAG